MLTSTDQIAIWILTALKAEWERDPSHLTCRPESEVLAPLKSEHHVEDADITRGIRFLIERRLLKAVNRKDGRATLPSPAGLDYLAAHITAQAATKNVVSPMASPTSYSLSIFISHSGKDETLAKALLDLLRAALNVPVNKIRCTSVNGHRLPAGASIDEQLRQEVHESQAFIGLITPSSMASTFVLFELGARWGADRHLVPLLGGGADASFLRGPLATLNALTCDDAGQIHQLVDDLAKLLGVTDKTSPAGYQAHVDRLIEASNAGEIKPPAQKPPASSTMSGKTEHMLNEDAKRNATFYEKHFSIYNATKAFIGAVVSGDVGQTQITDFDNARNEAHFLFAKDKELLKFLDDLRQKAQDLAIWKDQAKGQGIDSEASKQRETLLNWFFAQVDVARDRFAPHLSVGP